MRGGLGLGNRLWRSIKYNILIDRELFSVFLLL